MKVEKETEEKKNVKLTLIIKNFCVFSVESFRPKLKKKQPPTIPVEDNTHHMFLINSRCIMSISGAHVYMEFELLGGMQHMLNSLWVVVFFCLLGDDDRRII